MKYTVNNSVMLPTLATCLKNMKRVKVPILMPELTSVFSVIGSSGYFIT